MKSKLYFYFIFISGLINAQTKDTLTANPLGEIVITGQFEPQALKKSVFNVKVISQKDIKQLAANNLADVLNQYLNITVTPNAATGKSTVSLFGLDGQYFKILIDNIPVVSDTGLGNAVDLTQINLNDIERIEIIEGSMGVTHGGNAVTGVLNIITKKSQHTQWELQAMLQEETVGKEYALFNKGRHVQGLKMGYRINENWNAALGFNRNDFTGYLDNREGENYTINDGLRGYRWLPKMQYSGNALVQYSKDNFRFFYKADYLNENLSFYNSTVYSVLNPPFESRVADDKRYYTERYFHHLNISGLLLSQMNYTASLSHQKQKREMEKFQNNLTNGEELAKERNTDQSTEVLYSTGTISNFFKEKAYDFQLGYELVNTNGFSRVIGENNFPKEIQKRLENYDAFISGEIKANDVLSFRAGYRHSFQSKFDNQIALSTGMRYLFSNDLELRAGFGKSFRTPNFEELYSEIIFSGHYFIGNENLNPEQSYSYEVSLKKKLNINKVTINSTFSTTFLNVKDRIEMALVELEPIAKSQYINISKYQTWNISTTHQLHYESLTLSAGYSLVGVAQEINNGEAVSNDNFLFTSQFNASASYNFVKYNSVLSVYYKYNGSRQNYVAAFDDERNPVFKLAEVGAFSWLDASLSKSFLNNKLEVTLGGRNLLNITDVRQTQPGAGGAHATTGNLLLGYGRSGFLKLVYNLNF